MSKKSQAPLVPHGILECQVGPFWGQGIQQWSDRPMIDQWQMYCYIFTLSYFMLSYIIILTDGTSLETSPMNSQLREMMGGLGPFSCHDARVHSVAQTSRLAPMGAGGASDRPRGSLLPHRRISHLSVAAGNFRWSPQCECRATANKPDGMKHIETWHAVLVAIGFPSSEIITQVADLICDVLTKCNLATPVSPESQRKNSVAGRPSTLKRRKRRSSKKQYVS